MAKKNVYTVAGQFFHTKEELKRHIQSILHSCPVNQSLQGEDLIFMFELLKLHPRADEKIGCGLKDIRVVELQWRKPSFALERQDGSKTDFSFIKCIYPVSAEQLFRQACRALIAPEIMAFKKHYFLSRGASKGLVLCPITNELVTILQSHVDHEAPETFDKIINDFIYSRRLDVNAIEIGGSGDNETVRTLTDEKIACDFIEFHRQRAVLRVVSAKSNLTLLKK